MKIFYIIFNLNEEIYCLSVWVAAGVEDRVADGSCETILNNFNYVGVFYFNFLEGF